MIKVVITTWQVPFDQMIKEVAEFSTDAAALAFINDEAAKWWKEIDGERSVAECGQHDEFPYEPVGELGYDHAHYMAWGGECGFQAMIDAKSYWRLHAAHYKREYTDKGEELPGYLQNAMGVDTSEKIKEIHDYYNKPRH